MLFLGCAALAANAQSSPTAQNPPAPTKKSQATKAPARYERIEVVATKLPEDPAKVPAAVDVVTGDELLKRGARDLRSALAVATGIEIAPGGDGGPSSSVPDFLGLKEFDAFLLVVDGVPWGGAFNPALTTLDLNDVERIELLRGPAPVTYGATSFVGVIHVVRKDTASKDRTLTLQGGSFGTGGVVFSTPLPLRGNWSSRLTVDAQREGFRDERTAFRRGHGNWRVGRKGAGDNRFWFSADLNWLDQDPASPRLRQGAVLSPSVPVDANHNPAGAFLNDRRFSASSGFDQRAGSGFWSGTAAVSHSRQGALRGFLLDVIPPPANVRGLREDIQLTDVYLDSHISWKVSPAVTFLTGGDYLHGTGNAQGADFFYDAPLHGALATSVVAPANLDVTIHNTRNFYGAYASLEWHPLERVRLDAGVRANVTQESRRDADPGMGTSSADRRTKGRASASLGAIVTAWERNQDTVGLFVNYRDTYKPAAIDFGIESFAGRLILEPETSRSVQGGLKGSFWERRVDVEATGFLLNFNNLVTAVSVGGLPGLINAGTQRFKGFESSLAVLAARDVTFRATYSLHDARFRNFIQDFGGVPTQLAGKRLEMSARHQAGFGVIYSPVRGFLAGIDFGYTGARFLNKRNTALAGGFATVGLSAGYRQPRWELRVDARNLGDRRDPVAESELGDAQYYLMTNRRVNGTFTFHF